MTRMQCGEDAYPRGLLAVAAHRLPGPGHPFPVEPLPEAAWTTLMEAARKNRITGMLDAAVRDGVLPTTAEQARQAAAAHRTVQLRVLWLDQALVEVLGLLADGGVEARALKGSAVAHLDYPEPSLRSFIDLDVLVRAEDIARTQEVLGRAGFQRTLAEPRPGFDRRFDKGMTLIPPAGYELDLHRTFVLGPWGVLMNPADLWDDGAEFSVNGHRLRALSAPKRFLHACFHAALGDWPLRLSSLRDIAEMLRHVDDAEAADAAAVRRIAAAWGAEAVVAAAVADSRRLLRLGPGGALSTWAEGYRPSRREESWLALHTQPDKTFAALALSTLRVLRWRDKAAYVRALALPDQRYTDGRHASALGRFAYAARQVRTGRRTV